MPPRSFHHADTIRAALLSNTSLGTSHRLVLVVLLLKCDSAGVSRISAREVGWFTGLSERQVRRVLRELGGMGLVGAGDGKGHRRVMVDRGTGVATGPTTMSAFSLMAEDARKGWRDKV